MWKRNSPQINLNHGITNQMKENKPKSDSGQLMLLTELC